MGTIPSIHQKYKYPDITPGFEEDPTFDPNYGFPEGRKKRVMVATEEEMRAAKVPLENRDYCAHLLINYYQCRRKKFPWVYRCEHDLHVHQQCQYEDYVLRMKEFERERRLRVRQKRILAAQ